MNIFKKLFQSNKDKSHLEIQHSKEETETIKQNPAFEYIQEKYGIDCGIYRKLSSVIHIHSHAAANEFAEEIKGEFDENLVHFFFDYFLSVYAKVKATNLHYDNPDVYSALIDGIHIEFYGNVSNEVIESTLQLWTTENKCFIKTIIAALKTKEEGERMRLLISIASHCADKNNIGATEVLSLVEPFKQIQNSKLSSIDTFFNIFKSH